MAVVQPVQNVDIETGASSRMFMVTFGESPTFADRETAEQVAREINEVLEHSNG